MPSPDVTYHESMRLHQLPSDILVDVLHRVQDPSSLVRLASLSSPNLSSVATSDAVWTPTFQQIWGKSLYEKVVNSMKSSESADQQPETEAAEGIQNSDLRRLHFERLARQHESEAESATVSDAANALEANGDQQAVEVTMPEWMREHCCLSSEQEQAHRECLQLWQAKPSLMTAFSILARLVPQDFNANPDVWLVNLTEGEDTVLAKAKVAASFFYFFSPDRSGTANVRKAAVQCMTVKSIVDPLSQAIRREYVRNFDVRGCSLPAAMRQLLRYGAMPSEASRICRLLWVFAAEFHCQHGGEENEARPEPKKSTPEESSAPIPTSGPWVSQDVVYLLMWSLLVLNADAQNPHVKTKMQLHEWVKNTALALNGAGHVPAGVRPDGTLEGGPAQSPGGQRINHHQSWGGVWGEQHRLREKRVCVNEEEAALGSAVTAESLRGMYAEVLADPLLLHVSREPRVAKGLQRLTESTAAGFSLSTWTNGLLSWVTGAAPAAQPVAVQ